LLLTLALGGCKGNKSAAAPSGSSAKCSSSAPGGLAGGGGECITSPAASSALASPTIVTSAPPGVPVETEADCPYINAQDAEDLEGNRVGKVTTVSTVPVGCNFYFAYGDGHVTLQIQIQNFKSQVEAYNAMVATGGTGAIGVPGLVPGIDAVLYQTTFYAPDGNQDWACAFATKLLIVIVKTDQKSPSLNARRVCQEIAPKF
jgi:hypothetical protein